MVTLFLVYLRELFVLVHLSHAVVSEGTKERVVGNTLYLFEISQRYVRILNSCQSKLDAVLTHTRRINPVLGSLGSSLGLRPGRSTFKPSTDLSQTHSLGCWCLY